MGRFQLKIKICVKKRAVIASKAKQSICKDCFVPDKPGQAVPPINDGPILHF